MPNFDEYSAKREIKFLMDSGLKLRCTAEILQRDISKWNLFYSCQPNHVIINDPVTRNI